MENTEDPASAFSAPSTSTALLSGGSSPSFMSKEGRKLHQNPLLLRTLKKDLKTEQKKSIKCPQLPAPFKRAFLAD